MLHHSPSIVGSTSTVLGTGVETEIESGVETEIENGVCTQHRNTAVVAQSTPLQLCIGSEAEARFMRGDVYQPCKITAVNADGTYDVFYELCDDTEQFVQRSHIRIPKVPRCDILKWHYMYLSYLNYMYLSILALYHYPAVKQSIYRFKNWSFVKYIFLL